MSNLSSADVAPAVSPRPAGDMDLMLRARHGDRAGYALVVRRCRDRLFNAVLRVVGDYEEATEVAQEAFQLGRSRLEEFDGRMPPYAWLFQIALNLSVSRARKGRPRATLALPGGDEAHKPIIEALGRLDIDYRAVLVMREIDAMDHQQMADILDLPIASVKSRLFRARLALRDELKSVLQAGGGDGQ